MHADFCVRCGAADRDLVHCGAVQRVCVFAIRIGHNRPIDKRPRLIHDRLLRSRSRLVDNRVIALNAVIDFDGVIVSESAVNELPQRTTGSCLEHRNELIGERVPNECDCVRADRPITLQRRLSIVDRRRLDLPSNHSIHRVIGVNDTFQAWLTGQPLSDLSQSSTFIEFVAETSIFRTLRTAIGSIRLLILKRFRLSHTIDDSDLVTAARFRRELRRRNGAGQACQVRLKIGIRESWNDLRGHCLRCGRSHTC